MNLGIIARADRGGIAAQTYELVQNLNPAKVLVVSLQTGRGASGELYPGATRCDDPITGRVARNFLQGLDAVLTVEGWYGWAMAEEAAARGVRRILVANPELFRDAAYDTIVTPTGWMIATMPEETIVLAHPVSLDRFTQEQRTEVKEWYHIAAPAMLDRNGTDLLKQALKYIRVPTSLTIRDASGTSAYRARVGNVDVLVVPGHATEKYWEHWRGDALVMPRRYGGLCLPMQEAAAQGMPILTTDCAPQSEWFQKDALVPPSRRSAVGMKHGRVYTYEVDPVRLAAKMDAITSGDVDVKSMSAHVLRWARERSWPRLLAAWREVVQ